METRDKKGAQGFDHCTHYSGENDQRIIVTQPYDISDPKFACLSLDNGVSPEVINATDWAFYNPGHADLFIIKFPSGYEKALQDFQQRLNREA